MEAYRGTKPVKNNLFYVKKIFGIPFTLYMQKCEKNDVVNIFTYRTEWVNANLAWSDLTQHSLKLDFRKHLRVVKSQT